MVNGPVVTATPMRDFQMQEMVTVGNKKLIGEVVKIEGDVGTIQVYEETETLMPLEPVEGTGRPFSVKLGPGLIGNMFDGIERPLLKINEGSDGYISEGIGLISLDEEKHWHTEIKAEIGQELKAGMVYATVKESEMIDHKLMVPPHISGRVIKTKDTGDYKITDTIVVLELPNGEEYNLCLYQEWPVKMPRPVERKEMISEPLITGQRVLDIFFPLAKGGTAAIPGGFGTGKTMTQHQLAKWCDADIIVYIGCGERGNEMTEVLEDFPKLIDPRSNKPIMERTILIANTSNMPVAAREASIYTGITIAEYYRDMGYDVAIMADSTSRWAEALREISGRLEEMPAEEGYPAYLASRLSEFYERAGYVTTLGGNKASITVIGAVSPAGGDFSEPVTENTKRFVSAFLQLDKKLAYSRHYPAINWLGSYSGYIKLLGDWYKKNVSHMAMDLRAEMLGVLYEEDRLSDIVQLVGEDVLPDNQRLIIEISKVLKVGFLQQNAFNDIDTYVPINKQFLMLQVIKYLYDNALEAVEMGIPISQVKDDELFDKVIKMKYTIPNDNLKVANDLIDEIKKYYVDLRKKYSNNIGG